MPSAEETRPDAAPETVRGYEVATGGDMYHLRESGFEFPIKDIVETGSGRVVFVYGGRVDSLVRPGKIVPVFYESRHETLGHLDTEGVPTESWEDYKERILRKLEQGRGDE